MKHCNVDELKMQLFGGNNTPKTIVADKIFKKLA
jgi:hypothetical protein